MHLKQTIRLGILAALVASVLEAGGATIDLGSGTPTFRDLPEIRFLGPRERTVSQSDLKTGIEIPVEIVVPRVSDMWRAIPLDGAGCQTPDSNGLILFPVVHRGQDTIYCPACDIGYCARPRAAEARAPRAGTHRYVFRWRGERGFGPSHYARSSESRLDTRDIETGEYRVTVTTAFTSATAPMREAPRKSESSVVIRVVP